tara:strand:+ start:448 stop:621 length:174 start_codon:yes stop_codon:yes gene_type:complete
VFEVSESVSDTRDIKEEEEEEEEEEKGDAKRVANTKNVAPRHKLESDGLILFEISSF